MESVPLSGYLFSAVKFGDIQLHVEWAAPVPAKGRGQGRGNSGVFLMGLFEVQVLDSFENETYADGQAARSTGNIRRWPTPVCHRVNGNATTSFSDDLISIRMALLPKQLE